MPVARLLAALLVVGSAVLPRSAWPASPAWTQAEAAALWQQEGWHRLLHYAPGRWPGSWRSQADDPQFFLAERGPTDPRAELRATLEAFAESAEHGDEHAQCRFVARLRWLRQQIDLGELPQPDCAAYREFRKQVSATHAVLVFPSYYLNSPSSMFGHTLLRLDAGEADGGSEYLSFAVNFGALVDPDDNGLFYAFRGLTGGYRGQFEVDYYFKKIRDYNRDENRDIWEYPLDLSAEEIDRLIEHLWELRGTDFAYYFFDENCSYRLLELLEVARPSIELTAGFPITAIPIDTVRAVHDAGLIQGKHFRPAQGTVLRERLRDVPEERLDAVLEVSRAPGRLNDTDLQALAPAQRAAVTDAAYRFLRYTQTGQARDPDVAQRSFQLLQALQAQAADLAPLHTAADPSGSPDLSHGSRRLAFGLWSEEDEEYLSLGLRMSLHSLPENRLGFPAGAQINIGNLDLRVRGDGDLDLNRLDLVDIISISPRDRFFKPLSWAVMTGIERQWTDGRERRVAQVHGGAGAARTLWGDSRVYALGTARLEHNHGFGDPLQPALGVRGGLLLDAGPVTLHADVTAEQFANGATRYGASWHHNLRLSRQQALHFELGWREEGANVAVAVGLRYQWYY